MSRITVVNDRAEFLELMQEVLSGAGHTVTLLAAAADADAVAESRPDLLVIDLRLDVHHGRVTAWDLLMLSRSDERLRDVPVILCAADRMGLEQRREDLRRLTDVHLLPKPFELLAVEDLVGHLVARQADIDAAGHEARIPASS